tara:strand:+ start:797 stop:1183 length:387 start_codon:yes stop_codon:yes gene_type:complete
VAESSEGHVAEAAEHDHEASEGHQEHPLTVYFWIWILLFVFSTFSYAVDYADLQGYIRWTLILFFMVLKAGFIVAIFMHMAWERMALVMAICGPPVAILVLILMMVLEGDYTFVARVVSFAAESVSVR